MTTERYPPPGPLLKEKIQDTTSFHPQIQNALLTSLPPDLSSLSAGRSTAGPIRMSLNIFLI